MTVMTKMEREYEQVNLLKASVSFRIHYDNINDVKDISPHHLQVHLKLKLSIRRSIILKS